MYISKTSLVYLWVQSINHAARVVSVLWVCALIFLFSVATSAHGQVVINEVVAANSDRQLQRNQPGYPRVGITEQWYNANYNDAQWKFGNGPFGFGTFSGVTIGLNTSMEMQNKIPSLYIRKAFNVSLAQASLTNQVQFVIRYSDGFIAFLNGKEVARRNMGLPGMYAYCDQTSFNVNTNTTSEAIILGSATNLLLVGTNTLCIQTHNYAVIGTSADTLLCQADLKIATASPIVLVANNGSWSYLTGLIEPSGGVIDYGMILLNNPSVVPWASLTFNDSGWSSAHGPIGFDRDAPYYGLGVNLSNEVYNTALSIYVRSLFSVTKAEAQSTNVLRMVIDWDDGIIVYINGREAVRKNVGTVNTITPFDTVASSHNANGDGTTTNAEVTVSLGAAKNWLVPGFNVIGIQNHNSALTNSDMIGRVTLITTGTVWRVLSRPDDDVRYFVGTSEPYFIDEETDSELELDAPDSEGDWIELHNMGATPVDISGWRLTDETKELQKWSFPTGTTISAGGYLIVMATGYDTGPTNGTTYLHTNFKLSSEGEYLGLYDQDGYLKSEITPQFPPQYAFYSYARNSSGQFAYSDTATPGAANTGTCYSAILQAPIFSHAGGFYSASFTLQLSAFDSGATIRYTTNGSEPSDTNGIVYATPVSITNTAIVRQN